jgi:hypothetical protein
VDAIYFDLTSAFDLVPHSLLLHKLSALGFSGGYVDWILTKVYTCPAYNTPARIAWKTPLPTVLLLWRHAAVARTALKTHLPS